LIAETSARRSPVFASSPTKAGPVLQHPSYTEKWRSSRPKEGIWRVDAESPPHQSLFDRLGSRARQIPSMDDVLTAAPRSGVQPSASSDGVQHDVRAKQATSADESNEMMVMVNDFVREAREAAAAEAAIAAEAEAVENEDDDPLRVRLRCSRRIIEQPVL